MTNDPIVTVAATGLDAKRAEAKAYLGPKWVLHPDYVPNARHSNIPEIYQLARLPFLRGVAAYADKSRQLNPNFHRASHLRKQIGL